MLPCCWSWTMPVAFALGYLGLCLDHASALEVTKVAHLHVSGLIIWQVMKSAHRFLGSTPADRGPASETVTETCCTTLLAAIDHNNEAA